jgi:adenine-specific DNA-methyltransferase
LRYIGSKKDLVDFIYGPIREHNILGGTFCDIFTGTTVVAQFFKKKGFRVIANDIMKYSYVFARTYIGINETPSFSGLSSVIDKPNLKKVIQFLNSLPPKKGFMYQNYTFQGTTNSQFKRNYFSSENAQKIDAIRDTIQLWKDNRIISEDEFYVLLCSLLEAVPSVSNIAGTYGAFLKINDPRIFKRLLLRPPQLLCYGAGHECYNEDANQLIRRISCDILYLDPPYNTRQYAANYHILEAIAIWDKKIKNTKTGLIFWEDKKSRYCSKTECVSALEDLVANAKCKHILMSYNSEGIIPRDEIIRILSTRGNVMEYSKTYRRFKSHRRGLQNTLLKELLFYLKVTK